MTNKNAEYKRELATECVNHIVNGSPYTINSKLAESVIESMCKLPITTLNAILVIYRCK